MNLIVCADKNWAIGYNGQLLFHIPQDLKYFREMTLDKTVVMGRKTLESLPGSKPLANRENIVLSRDQKFGCEGITVINSIEEFLEKYNPQNSPDVFVIGGEQIYKALAPYCEHAYITRVGAIRPADVYIDDFDALENFELAERSQVYEHEGLKYTFDTYINTSLT